LSLPDSGFLLLPVLDRPLCHAPRVLHEMRNRRGAPNVLVRALALLLALLLAAPLTVLAVRAAARALELAQ
jgi:hypothetical protein